MKNILLLFVILLLVSCSEQKLESNTFELLPSTQQFSINSGESTLDASALQWTFSSQENPLPIRYGVLKNLAQIETAELAQIHFSINYQAGQQAESYSLKIEEEKIRIEAQDEAGLFYAFVTLSQIIDDAQGQALPVLEINDAPKIAFRPIQIDIKHHREKKTYYYELMDHLAQLKINGIILEIEDKLKYKRRPEVGSQDAMTIEEWKAISQYAQERNMNISPLVQGLGHASFILKHKKNEGQSKSIRTGILASNYENIITIDGDLQNNPKDIPSLIDRFNNEDFIKVGDLIVETLEGLQNNPSDNSKVEENVRTQVKELCDKYPIYN